MSNNPAFPIVPDPDEPSADDALVETEDGDQSLDPDVDDALIDSADADRIAAEGD